MSSVKTTCTTQYALLQWTIPSLTSYTHSDDIEEQNMVCNHSHPQIFRHCCLWEYEAALVSLTLPPVVFRSKKCELSEAIKYRIRRTGPTKTNASDWRITHTDVVVPNPNSNPNPSSLHNVLVGPMHWFALTQRSDAVFHRTEKCHIRRSSCALCSSCQNGLLMLAQGGSVSFNGGHLHSHSDCLIVGWCGWWAACEGGGPFTSALAVAGGQHRCEGVAILFLYLPDFTGCQ